MEVSILNGDAVGTMVSGHYRRGGRSSEVVVKRGSTVHQSNSLQSAYRVDKLT